MPKRLSLLAETAVEAAMAEPPSLDPEVARRLGPSHRSLMNRQSLLLASMAARLMKSGEPGPNLGLYCVLEIAEYDAEAAQIISRGDLAQTFAREISPFRVLRRMPAAQAFWGALAAQAEGCVRIFSWTPQAEQTAATQAELDLADGVCETALILCCNFNPWHVWGKMWAAR